MSSFSDCSSLLIKVSIALLLACRDQLFGRKEMEQILPFLLDIPASCCEPNNIMQILNALDYLDSMIEEERKSIRIEKERKAATSSTISKRMLSKRIKDSNKFGGSIGSPSKKQKKDTNTPTSIFNRIIASISTPHSSSNSNPIEKTGLVKNIKKNKNSPLQSNKKNKRTPLSPLSMDKTRGDIRIQEMDIGKENYFSENQGMDASPPAGMMIESFMKRKNQSFKEFVTPSPPPKNNISMGSTKSSKKTLSPVELTELSMEWTPTTTKSSSRTLESRRTLRFV
jgi:hypothetical protein